MKVIVVYPDYQEAQANQACVSFQIQYPITKETLFVTDWILSLFLILGGMRGVQGEVGAMGQKGNDGQQGAPGIQVRNW